MNVAKIETQPGIKSKPDNFPRLGEWYWVTREGGHGGSDGEAGKEYLLCVIHIGSNHVVFDAESQPTIYIKDNDLLRLTRLEPNWREIINGWINEKQGELRAAVQLLSDKCAGVNLIADESKPEVHSMLPALVREKPEEQKKRLVRLQEKELPEINQSIEKITEQMVYLHKNLFLPDMAKAKKLIKATKEIEHRLFALELYAGLTEGIITLRKGEPAPKETPISVRQMLLYMDEETLIEYDNGGMDFKKLDDFDEWIAKPENLNRILPEPRSVVGFQIRRYEKDYGECKNI